MAFLVSIIRKNLLLSVFVLVALILTIALIISNKTRSSFFLTRTSIGEGDKIISSNMNEPIYLFFSEKVSPKKIFIKISPEIRIKTEINNNYNSETDKSFIKITPLTWWETKTVYTIIVNKKTLSLKNQELNKDEEKQFSYEFPQDPSLFPPQPGPPPGFN